MIRYYCAIIAGLSKTAYIAKNTLLLHVIIAEIHFTVSGSLFGRALARHFMFNEFIESKWMTRFFSEINPELDPALLNAELNLKSIILLRTQGSSCVSKKRIRDINLIKIQNVNENVRKQLFMIIR
ncbi:hypothetical protein BpHYR1_036328 [Brachionus plicatilis]|uniref:Uncharacterized protein n=1 Tax=Brachionus plicatilis TaxID=10195 RepID=A0A3M7QGD8_BRAPC|nr:hypothetical protein BpHYR1_036328 [Brachionus plicatilis]